LQNWSGSPKKKSRGRTSTLLYELISIKKENTHEESTVKLYNALPGNYAGTDVFTNKCDGFVVDFLRFFNVNGRFQR